jgi:two-component system OmpR family sensor kinase
MSLRIRLMLGLLALAAIGLVILDAVSYTALRSYLMDRVDQQVTSATFPAGNQLRAKSALSKRGITRKALARHGIGLLRGIPVPPPGAGPGDQVFGPGPGPGPGEGQGRIGGTAPPGPPQLFPAGTFAELRNGQGKVLARQPFSYGQSHVPRPALPAQLPASGSPGTPDLFTVGSSGGSSSDFRAAAVALPGGGDTVVVAVPLSDVQQTLDRLKLIEVIVSGAVLAALAALAWWVIRLGLRPLERMEETANAIAGGDLSARVESTDARTEVGRLGIALNGMLHQIEGAFGERQASENRLRRFLADASHELRTPLSSIRGYAEIFRLGPGQDPAELGKAMRRIEDEAARMGGLVDDLLTLARLDEVREPVREPVDLATVAADACADARAAAPGRLITLEAAEGAEVLGDPDQLRQVIANLLRNALQHTPPGTSVEVSIASEGARARLEVRDHGPGLPEDAGEQVFERFWREGPSRKRDGAGAGLGLAIVRAVIAAHGGEVQAANAPGGGAVFTVLLPVRTAEPAGAAG